MPDNDDDQQNQDNPAQLRAALDAAQAQATRVTAMATAGVDFTSPVGQLFLAGYAGETTPEAIKAEWAKVAPTAPPAATPPPADTQVPPAGETPPPATPPVDPSQTDVRRDLASNGGTNQPPPADDPRDVLRTTIAEKIPTIGRNNALAEGVATLVQAAAKGDKRVIVDVWGPRG